MASASASLSEDHLRFLQSFPSTSDPPQVRDWSGVNVRSDASVGAVRTAVAQLEAKLDKEMEKLPEVKLKRARQQYAVDVTLDPDTAHPDLILSEDGKQVRLGDLRKILPYNPKRFDFVCVVLGKEGFSSGRFYFEVQVKGNTNWSLGVARESIRRKGEIDPKFWLLRLREGKNYSARDASVIPLCPRMKPQKIGVFVDYEGGQISFYDVETRSLLYLFKGCNFAEKLYPIFGSYSADDDKNAAPLIITSVY
uniref:E3 ubiquitin-protein ligase TRIM39-like n=1 Tax=Centroberyx gerrardi TaxID=166262 RepID=UPI003AAE49D9